MKVKPNRVAILQPNYIPWKGYFDIIHDVETFIFLDDVQYTKNDWRNRNKIKCETGSLWLTIPTTGSHMSKLVNEIEPSKTNWQIKHWKTIEQFYSKAPYYKRYKDFFQSFYYDHSWSNLSLLTQKLVIDISKELLGLSTKFLVSSEFNIPEKKQNKLMQLLELTDADIYISGPAAIDYIVDTEFNERNIELVYKNYAGYPEYPQFHPPFVHEVSIIDLLFHTGPEASYYIWGWRDNLNR